MPFDILERVSTLETLVQQQALLIATMQTDIITIPEGLEGPPGPQGEPGAQYPTIDNEIGVLNEEYYYGDGRRYGIFPNTGLNYEVTFSDRVTAWYKASTLPGVQGFLARGRYSTSLNLGLPYHNSSIWFDWVEITGIVHITGGVDNFRWLGWIECWDRVGITGEGTERGRFGTLILKADAAINTASPGVAGRGAHFVNIPYLEWDYLEVEDCAACIDALPGSIGNIAAVWIDCQGYSVIRGRIRILNSQTNGLLCNALGIFLEVDVLGYGNQDIQTVVGASGLTAAQIQLGWGACFVRCTGVIDGLKIRQVNATPDSDGASVYIPETGTVADTPTSNSRHQALVIRNPDITVGNGNRGFVVGSDENQTSHAVANVMLSGYKLFRLRTAPANTLASGYAGLNLRPPAAVEDHWRRLAWESAPEFIDFGTATEFKAEAVPTVALRNYSELDCKGFRSQTKGGQGRCVQVYADRANGAVMRGTFDGIIIDVLSGSGATPVVDFDGCTGMEVNGITINSANVIDAPALRIANNLASKIYWNRIVNFGDVDVGGVHIAADNTDCDIGGQVVRVNGTSTGTGVRFLGAQVRCTFRDWYVTNFDKGIDDSGSVTFTDCRFVGIIADANDVNSDFTIATIPLSAQSNCKGLTPLPVVSGTYDPASIADGAVLTTTLTIPITAPVALSDIIDVTFSQSLLGVMTWGRVTNAGTGEVTIYFQNETGSAQDITSGTLTVAARKQLA